MLLLTAGQGFTILVLSIMLWRRRIQGAQCKGESLPIRGRKTACGCKADDWAHILPLYLVFSMEAGVGNTAELFGDFSAIPHMVPSP